MDAPHLFSGIVATTAFHPLGYAKLLIQIGHEPVGPKLSTNIFGKEVLYYPNVLKYISHIKKTDGFFGMYRGILPRIVTGIIGTASSGFVLEKLKSSGEEDSQNPIPILEKLKGMKDDENPFKNFAIETSKETIARMTGIILSQPFHVIMIRQMAQYVGRETKYNTIYSSLVEIYENDGIFGFFAGLIPRILGEVLTIWMANLAAYVVNNYILEDKTLTAYTSFGAGLLVTQFTYPFQLVSTCMSVSGSGLKVASPPSMPVYTTWVDCWRHLSRSGDLKRGSSLFMRYYRGPVIMTGGKPTPAKDAFSN